MNGWMVLAAACLALGLSARAGAGGAGVGPDCRLTVVGGVPTFTIGGKPHPGTCYSTYDTHPPRLEARARSFARAGCDIFNFVAEVSGYGFSQPMWVGPDQWDFAALDERAHTILRGAPRAWLLPRIYLDAPDWWRASNPGEMMLLDNGSPSFGEKLFALARPGDYPSLASAKWRGDMERALRTVIAHVEASDYGDRVIGYQLSGQKTEEWYHWSMNTDPLGDYSAPMLRAFRSWLCGRYRSDAALRAAWHRDDVSLATAEIPSRVRRYGDPARPFRDPAAEADVVDFHRFWSDVMADTIARFAGVVREATGGRKLVGAFYGYTFEFTELAEDAGHLALGRLLRSPNLDFVMAPSSYFDRNLPGKPYFRLPIASVHRHGKVFWNDFDQVSYKYFEKLREDPSLKTWEWQMGLTRTPEEFVWMCRREVGMELAQGVQLAFFDIHGGYYDDPVIMEGVRELAALRRRALAPPDRGSDAQVLLLADEESEHWFRFRSPALRPLLSDQAAQMPFVAPYDTALLSDLDGLDLGRYRLVIVLNALRLGQRERRLLDARLKADGRTVVWLYAPGYLDEAKADVGTILRLTGIRVREVPGTDAAGEERVQVRGPAGAGEAILPAGRRFLPHDPAAEPVAVAVGQPGRVLACRRRMGAWTSVYAAGMMPTAVLKSVAREAGVHIYDDGVANAVFGNRRFLTVCADKSGGTARLRLRRPATVRDACTGALVARRCDAFDLALRPKEVRLLRLE